MKTTETNENIATIGTIDNGGVLGNSCSYFPVDKLSSKLKCKNIYFLEQFDLLGKKVRRILREKNCLLEHLFFRGVI